MAYQPNRAAILYDITFDKYRKETATTNRTIQVYVDRTDQYSRVAGQSNAGGQATAYTTADVVDVKGKLMQVDGEWYRIEDEFQPLRHFFQTAIHHVELQLAKVKAPEVIV